MSNSKVYWFAAVAVILNVAWICVAVHFILKFW